MVASGFLNRWRCRRWRPALVDLAEGALAGEAGVRVVAHVAACGRCRERLDALRAARAVLAGPPPALPDEEAFWRRQRQGVMRRIRQLEPEPARPLPVVMWGTGLATTAGLVLLAAVQFRGGAPATPGPANARGEIALDADAAVALADGTADLGLGDELLAEDESDASEDGLDDDDLEALDDLIGVG